MRTRRTKHRGAYLREPSRGFTLTEVAIVLGIVGIILGGIWAAAAQVYENHKVEAAENQILTIVHNVRSLYAGRSSIEGGDLTAALVNAGVFPPDMIVVVNGVNVPEDPAGNTVHVGSQTGWDGIPNSNQDLQVLVGWYGANGSSGANTLSPIQCAAELGGLVNGSTAGDGLVYMGGQNVGYAGPITATSYPNVTTMSACSGHFTLEFSLH